MTADYAMRAGELVVALEDALEMQQVIIDGMKDSLLAYTEFLTAQVKQYGEA